MARPAGWENAGASEFIHTLFRSGSGKNDSFHFCGRSPADKMQIGRSPAPPSSSPPRSGRLLDRSKSDRGRISARRRSCCYRATRPSKQNSITGSRGFAKCAIETRTSNANVRRELYSLNSVSRSENSYETCFSRTFQARVLHKCDTQVPPRDLRRFLSQATSMNSIFLLTRYFSRFLSDSRYSSRCLTATPRWSVRPLVHTCLPSSAIRRLFLYSVL